MVGDEVHVWLIRVDLPAAELGGLSAVLDPDERRRADRLALDGHRRRFIAAHGIARVIVGHWLSVPAEDVGWRRGPHGKPSLVNAPAHVNLSHSGDLALLAISERRRCGVDVQRLPDARQAVRLARRFFPADELRAVVDGDTPDVRSDRFGLLWARKEACLKVAGGRLMPGLRLPALDTVVAGRYRVRDLAVPAGFRAAVALEGDSPYRVVRHWWPPELDHEVPETMAVERCWTVSPSA